MNYTELGRRLIAARQKANLTTVEAALRIGLDVYSILSIEDGVRKIEIPELVALCDLYQFPIGELLENIYIHGVMVHTHEFRVEVGSETSIRYCTSCGKSWMMSKAGADMWIIKWIEIED